MEWLLKNIERPMVIAGGAAASVSEALSKFKEGDNIHVMLKAVEAETQPEPQQTVRVLTGNDMRVNHTYIFKVRQYMTKPSTEDFDFHFRWNNNTPMPFRVMEGRVLKETRGMLMMDCHVVPLKTDVCMRCGRPLSHPVSRLYGIGPECGGHAHINPFETEQELYDAIDEVNNKLNAIKWRGWVIKSAIEECQEVRKC